jgi:transposase-like protein
MAVMIAVGVNKDGYREINWLQLWYKETLKINAGVKDATRWKSTTVFTGV